MNSFKPSWNSLSRHLLPQWLMDAKFGIYTHWGPYSVPAYVAIDHWRRNPNVTWYGHDMYENKHPVYRHHLKAYGESKQFGYKDFIPQFKAEKFDAEEWAQVFKDSGAKFAGPVAVHHDNFAMWKSKANPWNSVAMGPKRDVTGELEKAIKGQGLKFIATFHHAFNWWFFPKSEEFDTVDSSASGLYSRQPIGGGLPDEKYLLDWYNQIVEVIDGYDPDMIWFDFCLGRIPERYRKHFLAYYYNKAAERGKEVTVAFKRSGGEGFRDFNLSPMAGLLDLEMGKMNELTPHAWLTDTCIDANPMGCWGHARSIGYKSPERLIHNLVDMVSKNGYMLLNVGPRADGTLPTEATDFLQRTGQWYRRVREALDGATPCSHLTANRDVLLTRRGPTLYVILYADPRGDAIKLKPLAQLPRRATLLNTGAPVACSVDLVPSEHGDQGRFLRLTRLPVNTHANTVLVAKLEFDHLPDVIGPAKDSGISNL